MKKEKRFHIFVANRIQTIKTLSEKSQWFFVRSTSNPVASRGATVQELRDNTLWWQGPEFLRERKLNLDQCNEPVADDEREVKHVFITESSGKISWIDRASHCSSWYKMQRAISNARRYIRKLILSRKETEPKEASRV